MLTVSAPASEFNAPQFRRTSALPDEAFTADAIAATELDAFHHEMSIDFGDDAVNADAACAEQAIIARVPNVTHISVRRLQRRFWSNGTGDFKTEWEVAVVTGGKDAAAIDADLDRAVAAVLAKCGVPLAA